MGLKNNRLLPQWIRILV
ncbi:hypothetical protein J7K93_12420 [bacterium]|nr:hypothetical protein [bacterium]